ASTENLGQRAGADHAAAAVQGVERRQRLTFDADLTAGAVLQDHGVELVRQLEQLVPPPQRLARPGRVLEVDDRIDELASPPPPAPAEQALPSRRRHDT